MNEKLDKMTKEFLLKLDGFVPKEIEQIKIEWLKELTERKSELKDFESAINYVNAVCDVAINRAKRKMVVA
jgi:hypothetical protein|nr:MAG TPA: hypothetical protein [Caudoviricetes sp.]